MKKCRICVPLASILSLQPMVYPSDGVELRGRDLSVVPQSEEERCWQPAEKEKFHKKGLVTELERIIESVEKILYAHAALPIYCAVISEEELSSRTAASLIHDAIFFWGAEAFDGGSGLPRVGDKVAQWVVRAFEALKQAMEGRLSWTEWAKRYSPVLPHAYPEDKRDLRFLEDPGDEELLRVRMKDFEARKTMLSGDSCGEGNVELPVKLVRATFGIALK